MRSVGRKAGRVGGAVAGIIAIIFGILDVQDKVPAWLLFVLGAAAIAGVMFDYLWEHQQQSAEAEAAPTNIKQTQHGGRNSTNNQAGRDITIVHRTREQD
jgi:hypothetical protein